MCVFVFNKSNVLRPKHFVKKHFFFHFLFISVTYLDTFLLPSYQTEGASRSLKLWFPKSVSGPRCRSPVGLQDFKSNLKMTAALIAQNIKTAVMRGLKKGVVYAVFVVILYVFSVLFCGSEQK